MIRLPHNLEQLRAAWRAAASIPARDAPCFRMVDGDGPAPKLYVYDVIGGWDLDAQQFVQAVHAVDAPALDVHINSPGGFVYDAVSMFEALQQSPATVNVNIDGLAASAASFLAQAGDSVKIAAGGRMMIHDAQGIGIGSPADMREYADMLDAVSDDIAGYYANRAGGTPADWRAAMTATTWYSSAQAVDAKLADSVTGKGGATDQRTADIRARARALLKGA